MSTLARLVPVAAVGTSVLIATAAFVQAGSSRVDPVDGIEVAEGLVATVFAEAPMLFKPTNIDVDARGRVWVLEGSNYRTTLHPENPVREAGDRIVILEDTTGDGRADSQKVFYQGRDIDAAMGIAVLGDKVIVSAYENVFVFTDADGDDVPESKEVLFKLADRDHDHTVHAFVFGPDGRLYFNVGDVSDFVADPQGNVLVDMAGNRVTNEGNPYRKGMVFRVEPDGSNFEVLGHNFRNPYEATVDAYGTVWQSDNDDDGNRATRLNYVMEYGNFGYTDEMTGAAWSVPRTGMEEEIPLRHWHLNDPGVVPNVMNLGSGSPSGIAIYEADLLPPRFHGTLMHAEPGHNVVRAYRVEPDGAGYRGETIDVAHGVRDPFFRPVDVAVAPDGSLFVADWYDPGVGGHDVGDLTGGRILRIAPEGIGYRPTLPDLSTPRAAVAALASPNIATRYLAYEKLRGWGARGERALAEMWRSPNSRERARALWLLGQMGRRGDRYIEAALQDPDPNIRITGLRVIRRTGRDIIPAAKRLVRDDSPQVRREVALALRHHPDPEAALLWTELAIQYDGRDRWYLEALGIGADRQWDRFFATWRERVGEEWKTPQGRDIVWRARTEAALPLLAELIHDPGTAQRDLLRYFRAFDFHSGPERQRALLGLLDTAQPQRDEITTLVLSHLDPAELQWTPALRSALERSLASVHGTRQFVELVRKYELQDRANDLMRLALAEPEQSAGVDAARLVLRWQGIEPFRALIDGEDAEAASNALTVLGRAGGSAAASLLQSIALDPARPLAVRLSATRLWGPSWNGQIELVKLLEQDQLPEELAPLVRQILSTSFRPQMRAAAAQYFGTSTGTTADGKTLPASEVLAQREGDPVHGRAVYVRACAVCHVAGDIGQHFGPELTEIGSKLARQAMYDAILHPSAGISFGYEGTVIKLRDGGEVVGIITSETEQELVLALPGGITIPYRSADVISRTRLETSMMPEGLHSTMTEQELVDLVEYMASLRQAGP
jgi:putative membrane-bound dehydrogenase-like protein